MAAEVNRQVRLKARPDGIPQAAHFEIVESAVPAIGEGQFLVRNRFLSVEPAMRGWVSAVANYSTPVGIGEVMRAFAAGEIVTRGTRTTRQTRLIRPMRARSFRPSSAPSSTTADSHLPRASGQSRQPRTRKVNEKADIGVAQIAGRLPADVA